MARLGRMAVVQEQLLVTTTNQPLELRLQLEIKQPIDPQQACTRFCSGLTDRLDHLRIGAGPPAITTVGLDQ